MDNLRRNYIHSNDVSLEELLGDVDKGKTRLPEFQRSWIWDNERIRGIIASISQGYPMGAILYLEYGNPEIKFKCNLLEGVKNENVKDDVQNLVLDGQQRLTSIYQALYSKRPVITKSDKKVKGKKAKGKNKSPEKENGRYYYLLMEECFNENEDRKEAVLSVPADRIVKEDFDRKIVLDLSSVDKEIANKAFPLNLIFDNFQYNAWSRRYWKYYSNDTEAMDLFDRFSVEVVKVINDYKVPVITIPKKFPREAVCRMFENVNTGGVALTVFELLTATFAAYETEYGEGFNLREDWEECEEIIQGKDEDFRTDLLDSIDATTFLTAVTLYTSYMRKQSSKFGAVSCKKKDVLSLDYSDYVNNRRKVAEGFRQARNFLLNYTYVFRKRDLPYTAQLIPMAAVFAVLGDKSRKNIDNNDVRDILSKWYWCGIFGEMYGSASETRYANDIEDLMDEIEGHPSQMRTVNASFFSATRLLSLQSRGSAAYKGIMALLYMKQCQDFMSKISIDKVKSMSMAPDIHHIFPEDYCEKEGIERKKYNCIVNKTPLLPETNRSIGGRAPSEYTKGIINKVKGLTDEELKTRIESHFINYEMLVSNNFDAYFIDRAKKLLDLIEDVTGKSVGYRESPETIREFGGSLL